MSTFGSSTSNLVRVLLLFCLLLLQERDIFNYYIGFISQTIYPSVIQSNKHQLSHIQPLTPFCELLQTLKNGIFILQKLDQKMETNQTIGSRGYPTVLPCDTWSQYEQLRLERIQQQRRRMENMKDVVGQYSQIISDLEHKNRALTDKLTQKNRNDAKNEDLLAKNQELIANNKWMTAELERQRKMNQSYKQTIDQLRAQLMISDAKDRDYEVNQAYSQALINRQRDYETLASLYSELKEELYTLHKQNFSLKDVIEHQSKLFYEKPQNLTNYLPKDQQNQKKTTNIKIKSIGNQNSSPPIDNATSKRQKSDGRGDSDKYRRKIKQLKKELKQQYELIEKFKQTEEQQLQLIESLKSQKSKICLCHTHGASSKKIVSSNKLSRFNINGNSKENQQSQRK